MTAVEGDAGAEWVRYVPAVTGAAFFLLDILCGISDRHLVLFHTILASVGIAVMLVQSGDLHISQDRLEGTTPLCVDIEDQSLSEIVFLGYMAGFFIYDLYICVKTKSSFAWYLHGAFSLTVYVVAFLFGWAQGFASRFVTYEWSSIFYLTYRQVDRKKYPSLYQGARLLFAVVFIIVRFFYGLPLSYAFQISVWNNYEKDRCIRVEIQTLLVVTNTLFAFLNMYWGFLIIASAVGKKDAEDGNKSKKE
mmetsp:Transcript_15681/g.38654  ORF Transcript_15681/g.38654 Transcript_15681/m.38654 type:complete len:249 (-) Transcript_15681:150-896(-)